jgi:hypothetical protein
MPRKYNVGVNAGPTHPGILYEANNFLPYYGLISGFGPQAGQNWSSPTQQDQIAAGNTSARNALIAHQVGMISDRIITCENVGINFRHVAWPWPFMWADDKANKAAGGGYQQKPVPAGFMTQMLDAFYAAGTRRFFSFQWRYSRNLMTTAQLNQAIANLEEAAAWIQAKANAGKVVVIGDSFA